MNEQFNPYEQVGRWGCSHSSTRLEWNLNLMTSPPACLVDVHIYDVVVDPSVRLDGTGMGMSKQHLECGQ
jgi:hypothetical protein